MTHDPFATPRPVGWTPPRTMREAVVRSWARVLDDEPPGAWQEADLFLAVLDDLGYVVVPKTDASL